MKIVMVVIPAKRAARVPESHFIEQKEMQRDSRMCGNDPAIIE